MRKIIIVLYFICVLFAGYACGGEGSSDDVDIVVPEGMEKIKEGDVNLVVYKGARMRKENDVIIPETPDEYTVRKFTDTDNRFKKMEKELETQKKELEDLKEAVNKLKEDARKK